MRKTAVIFMFLTLTISCLLSLPAKADTNLAEYQIASILMQESASADEVSMSHVADVIRNRLVEQHGKGNQAVTYSDVVFQSGFKGSNSLQGMSSKDIQDYWSKQNNNTQKWNTALKVAQQTVKGTLPKTTGGANNYFYDTYNSNKARNYPFVEKDPNSDRARYFHSDANIKNQNIQHKYDDIEPSKPEAQPEEPEQKDWHVRQPEARPNRDGVDAAGGCGFDAMQKIYMEETSEAGSCWYCNVVIVLMNSFFAAAGKALPSSIALGKLILQYGFALWLAYYILQQVSSLAPVTSGKMLQDILFMGFKVALAYLAVEKAGPVIADYFINPVLDLGIKYGLALFDGLSAGSLL